ncbi:fimbrial protein [Enterobacter oligotrophicus]|uniref:fimbrial protein n=1 Tax=Enterobacter TaxID=547 RepID=UPI001C034A2E|nr:fimbrial protein [Enterobacter oligotrophicus]ELW1646804.1 fimbrial protein [Enterobacter oligotrophicus]MBT9426634.1 fimbrial protein [Enterobacter oligotrophicus]
MNFKGRLTGSICTTVMLLLVQGYAWGECHFGEDGEGGTSTIVNTLASSPVYFHAVPTGQFPQEGVEIGGPYEATLSPALWSDCDAGTDGEQMSNITYDAIGGVDGAMWPTNIPGIYYAVRIYSDKNVGSYFQYSNGQWTNLPLNASQPDHSWKAQIKLIQTSEFIGNTSYATVITPKESKKIGGMSVGGHTSTDNQPWWFNVTTSTFSLPIAAATCQATVVNGGTNNVDFGEMMFSSIREGFYPRQGFNLQLKGCSNVTAIKYKVSSNNTSYTSGVGDMMTNTLTSDAAAGVGVIIEQVFEANPSGHGEPFINDPSYIYVGLQYQVGANSSIDLPFMAYLKRDNNTPLKAGNFKAIATFTIDYL